VLSLLVICVLLLAACGGGSAQQQKTTVLTVTPNSIGGDFTKNFNPFSATPDSGTQGMIYETLLFFNSMDGSIHPWLASSYQFSSDATSITFNIHPNVQWSDGQPFTSDDVVFTLNMLKQFPALDLNGLWGYLKGVSAPNASTVKVTLSRPYTPILWYLGGRTWIVPKHIWSSIADPVKEINANPVGTGPFVLKSFIPQLIDLAKNPKYWQPGKPEVSELRYPAYDSNTTAELQLDQGKLDWTGIYTPNIQKTFVSRDPTHNHYWFPPSSVVMLYVNLAKPPFNQLAVRQAMSLAIDRQQLNKVGESGYEPPAHPSGLVLPAQQKFLSPDYTNASFTVDTAKANQLLQSAGFTKGSDGIYADKNGHKLDFKMNVVTGWTDWVTDCQIMANELKAIGMNVFVNSLSYNAYYSALQLGNFDTAISWTNPGPTPFFMYDSLLYSKYTAPLNSTAVSNWERWKDPATDQLLNQYASSVDSHTQTQALYGLQKIVVEQLPSIPLIYGATWYEYSTAHFSGWPDANNQYAVPSPYTLPDAEIVVLNLHPVS
jgi:peptide/nickel transport system substrate-binding protein